LATLVSPQKQAPQKEFIANAVIELLPMYPEIFGFTESKHFSVHLHQTHEKARVYFRRTGAREESLEEIVWELLVSQILTIK
jgi:hypothetical protein